MIKKHLDVFEPKSKEKNYQLFKEIGSLRTQTILSENE